MIMKPPLGQPCFKMKMEIFYPGDKNEAKRKGEVYEFDSKREMSDFARKGNWKK
jgi:hypothetical protein